MATLKNTNAPATTGERSSAFVKPLKPVPSRRLSQREQRIRGELADRGIALDSPEAKHYRNRFLWSGTTANAALAEVALLENRSPTLILEAIGDLDGAVMFKRVTDEWYHTQKNRTGPDIVAGIANFGMVEMCARLYVAGMIAERAERRRRTRQRQSMDERAQIVSHGVAADDLEERLP